MTVALLLAGLEGGTDIYAAMSKPGSELSDNQKLLREQIQKYFSLSIYDIS